MRANRFVNADVCRRPPAAPALSAAAGYGQRYALPITPAGARRQVPI